MSILLYLWGRWLKFVVHRRMLGGHILSEALSVWCSGWRKAGRAYCGRSLGRCSKHFLNCFTAMRPILHQAISSRPMDAGISSGTSPSPLPNTNLHRSVRAILHRPSAHCAFTRTFFTALAAWRTRILCYVVTLKTVSTFMVGSQYSVLHRIYVKRPSSSWKPMRFSLWLSVPFRSLQGAAAIIFHSPKISVFPKDWSALEYFGLSVYPKYITFGCSFLVFYTAVS